MKLQTLFLFAFVLIILSSCSQKKYDKTRNITVAFYNVENLFDLEDEPGKNDDEFTPGNNKKWTAKRYQTKIDTLARVLSSINENELPELIGLCEVENRKVVEDLVNSKHLKEGYYKVVHYESPDFRGIDCALVYRPDEFKVIK
ncbi:MAG: endonuclease/exonuclease/phosphatase family protein, partial [Bacteroidetes bacterium]|nr:endonuclease/exonuclease/phosphatase family protein [Bacteroidota bacterium]